MSAEDSRQRELVSAFEQDPQFPSPLTRSDCISYNRPSAGGVAKLMLEVLKNLEGDDGFLVAHLVQALIRAKLLMLETMMFENEPDFDALVKTPTAMIGEPHTTFPRIVEVLWMAVTDPSTVKKHGWCTLSKMTSFLQASRPIDIARHMRASEQIISRARFIMEEFIQHVTPLNMEKTPRPTATSVKHQSPTPTKPSPRRSSLADMVNRRPVRMHADMQAKHHGSALLLPTRTETTEMATTEELEPLIQPEELIDGEESEENTGNNKGNDHEPTNQQCPIICHTGQDVSAADPEFSREDRWVFRYKKSEESQKACLSVHPNARDIGKRFYAILPYFDKDHANTVFLHKFRGTVNQMSQGADMLDREAAFYAAVLTPIVFMQHYRDTWCLLERFHRALRLYQISHPTEKRASLKLLQNLRPVNQKIRSFLVNLPSGSSPTRTPPTVDVDDEDLPDKKDIRYLKELVKNLG